MRDHPCQPLTGYGSMDDVERIERVTAFRDLMAARRTVRDFSDRPVPRVVVEQALLTAGSAPSGANHQPWFFSVIESASARGRIRAAADEMALSGTRLRGVLTTDRELSCRWQEVFGAPVPM